MRNFLLLILFCAASIITMAQKKPFRIGVAGLTHGHVGGVLDRADDGDLEIVGIAEPDKALAEKYLKRYKLPMTLWYATVEEMLDKTKPEAVSAFNATFDHLRVVELCAPKKIHVMVEKPLAVSVEHVRKIEKLARENKIHVITNYETTWYGSNTDVTALAKEIAPLRKIVIHDGHEGPKEIGVGKEFLDWLTDPVKNGGGALMDFGCYGANLSTWLMDGRKPETVTAVTQQMKPEIYKNVDDEATIILTYPGTQAIIQASWNWPFGRKDMEVYGMKGYIIADKQGSKIKTDAKTAEKFVASKPYSKPYDDPFTYFAAVVRGEIKMSTKDLGSLENNVIVVEILEAAKQSAASGKAVHLK